MRYKWALVPPNQLSDSDFRALAEFRFQLRVFLAFSESQARAVGLQPQQHQALLVIRAATPDTPTIKALARRLVLRHHSAVELVDRLQRRRLVRRARSDADRRVARVELTRLGEDLLSRLALAHRAELRRAGPRLMSALQRLPLRAL
jgi:DNA-binding MarR family transcriptional regulator